MFGAIVVAVLIKSAISVMFSVVASPLSSLSSPFCPLGIILNKNPSFNNRKIRRSCSSLVNDFPTNPFM